MESTIDVLMITYDRPHYVEKSLSRLLDTCDDTMRVWLWHNGDDAATLAVTSSFTAHPRVAAFHHSSDNAKLRQPTNWFWERADGAYVAKVDDDCLVSHGWAQRLRDAHEANDELGVIGSWRFLDEDLIPWLAARKVRRFRGGHEVMVHPWVQGSGYLMKRRCVDQLGPLGPAQSFTGYCIELALRGYVNGWYHPFIREDHMDDPRSPNTGLHTDDDLRRRLPLTAVERGITTLAAWEADTRLTARMLQASPSGARNYVGVRGRAHRLARRVVAAVS